MFGEFGFPGVSPSGGAPSHSAPRAVETMQPESLFRQRISRQLTQYHRIFTDGPGLGVWTFGPVAPQTNRLLIGGLRVPSLNPGDSCRCCVRRRAKHVSRRQLASAGVTPLLDRYLLRGEMAKRVSRGPETEAAPDLVNTRTASSASVRACHLVREGTRSRLRLSPFSSLYRIHLQRWLCRRHTRP
jgi:hypothetical protein